MRPRYSRAVAGVAIWMGLAGAAGAAGTRLTTTGVYIDQPGYTMYCDSTNSGTTPVQLTTEFVTSFGTVTATYGPETLGPGQGASHVMYPGDTTTFYCRVTVVSGNPRAVRALALFTKNGRYLATSDAR